VATEMLNGCWIVATDYMFPLAQSHPPSSAKRFDRYGFQ
jgi:hypothetical protein